MDFAYRFRGWILGLFAVALLLCPSGELQVASVVIFMMLFALAALIRVKARCAIGEHTRGSVHDADVLVTWGMYGRMRHPLYVSNTLFAIGFVFLHLGFNLFAIPFVLLIFLFEYSLSCAEDRYLKNRFGKTWRDWASKPMPFFRANPLEQDLCAASKSP